MVNLKKENERKGIVSRFILINADKMDYRFHQIMYEYLRHFALQKLGIKTVTDKRVIAKK